MIEHDVAGRGVEGRRDEVPGVIAHGLAGGDLVLVDAQLDIAVLIEEQAISFAGRPFGDQALRAVLPVARMGLGRGRPDPALQREALDMERLRIRHIAVGAAMDDLLAALVGAVHRRFDRLLDEAGAARIGVAIDHLHQLGLVFGRSVAIDIEFDRVPGWTPNLSA